MPETEIPKTGPEAILHALSQMNADSIEAEAKAALATGKKTHRNKAVQKLRIVEGLRRNQLEPKDYMITKVPVIPTRFRPFAAQGDTLIPGDANILYKDLLDVKAAHDEERKMFGEKNAGTSRLALYDAVKASYGYGDPVKPKTKEKDVQGFLKVIVGRTAKRGFVQSKLMSKTQDNVGRSTIIVDPELSMDEIGIPKAMAFTMYAPYIQRHLKQAGYRDAEALKHVKDQTPEALAALERIVRERPVLYSRAPAWHKFSVNAGNVKLVDEDAISISPAVTSGLGADFNGDSVFGDTSFTFRINGLVHTDKIRNFSEKITGLSEADMIKEAMHYTRIYKLAEGVETLALDFESLTPKWYPVSQLTVHTSHGECYEITTHTNKIIGATEHHNFVQLTDELELETVKTESLKEGSFIPAVYNFSKDCTEPVYINLPGNKESVLLDTELAWFLGFFVAEGSTGGGAVTLCCVEDYYLKKGQYMFQKLFGSVNKKQDTKLHKQCIIRDYKKVNIEWMQQLCGNGFADKKVPTCIWEAPAHIKMAFLQGVYDGDGSCKGAWKGNDTTTKNRRLAFFIELANRPLVEQLCGLAASIGIRSTTPRTTKAHAFSVCHKDIHRIMTPTWEGPKADQLRKALSLYPVIDTRDKHDIIPIPKSVLDLFYEANKTLIHPTKEYKRALKEHRAQLPGKKVDLTDNFKKNPTYTGRGLAINLIWTFDYTLRGNALYERWKSIVMNRDLQWERITSVTRTQRPDVTYDVTVPGSELFAVHGNLLVHNTINVHVPASDDAVKEAYEKLMPSKHAFSDRDSSKVVPLPKQEQILGLYTAATSPATKPVIFDTEEDAIRAIRQGKVPLSADVEIRGQQKYAAADKKEEDLVEGIRKPGDEKGPVRVPKTGRFMKTVREHDDVRSAVNKTMKEKGKDLRADEYAEEYAREYAREVARRNNK